MIKNNIVLIQSHCDDDYSKNVLLDNIKKLKEYDVDILLFSHITLPEYIIKEVNYFVFDKSNPILYEEREQLYWWENENYRLETKVPDYGWTVFNQIIKSTNLISELNYKYVFLFCYDTIIDNTINNFLLNPKSGIFKHIKDDGGEHKTSLIFSVFEKHDLLRMVKIFSKDEYINKWDLMAESYFEYKLKEVNLYNHTNLITYDIITHSNNVFNQSKNDDYELFVSTTDMLKFRIINKKNKNITVVINDTIIKIEPNKFIYNKQVENVEIFGCFIDDKFDNWVETLNEERVNKIIEK